MQRSTNPRYITVQSPLGTCLSVLTVSRNASSDHLNYMKLALNFKYFNSHQRGEEIFPLKYPPKTPTTKNY